MQVEPKIMEHVKAILTKFGDKYIVKDNLKKHQVIEDLDHYDHALMTALLSDELIHKVYTEKVLGTEIFKLNQFIEMFEYKDFWEDSYTKYQNEIGLTVNGEYIKNNSDVVLDFPFKDCVLKASMSKEDMPKGENANEPFLNETLAAAEIDELFEPKVLVNAKKYDQNGEHPITTFSDDDNLVIKGNNLIALHSIQKRYAGKIKMIFIDPPYNTGSDSFKYNDYFKRAAWLTFMKNRLEIAKCLLADDGIILIQISFHQYPYLRLLLDDKQVWGECKHLMDMNVLVRHPKRTLTSDKEFNDVMEYTLIYSKDNKFKMPKEKIMKTVDKYDYRVKITSKNPDEILQLGDKKVEVYYPSHVLKEKVTPNKNNLHRETIRGSIREKNSSGRFYVKYLENLKNKYEPETIFKVPNMGDDELNYRYFELPKTSNKNGAYYQGMPTSKNYTERPYPNFYDAVNVYNNVNKEGNFEFRNGKKPEELLQYYLNIFTNKNDLVMDFFMGSGTTSAVAMKMHRRFIGIEQMDYINTVSVPRLQKVIADEQSGISKDVNWQGGGSFVYAELMEKNMGFLKDLQKAQTLSELNEVYERMKQGADFDFKVDLAKFEQDRQEKQRSLDEQKQTLMRMLDKNQLYYNEADLDDTDVRELLSDDDYQFNQSFYQMKDN